VINFADLKFRIVYWIVNKLDKFKEIHFMNYGYHDPDKTLSLEKADETNRYSIQLYNHLTDIVDLKNKKIVEIGCGRGGGLAYIAKYYSPDSLKGIDLSSSAINYSKKNNKFSNVSFQQGDAQKIPLSDNSCDVVINVESSHRYLEMDLFMSEVIRILKRGGYFLFTDFRYDYEWTDVNKLFERSELKRIFEKDITPYVLNALNGDDLRRRTLVRKLAPGYLQEAMLNFAGCIGSETYLFFLSRQYVYKSYAFQKL
jgi:ubiquinone/menaquinone biosynthesis C-methylase UbiE